MIDWNATLAAEVSSYEALPLIERAVRHALSDGKERTTTELMVALWPLLPDESTAKAARERLGRSLQTLAKGTLSDCARRAGERTVRRYRGGKWMMQKQNPWLWRQPAVVHNMPHTSDKCPTCGQPVQAGTTPGQS